MSKEMNTLEADMEIWKRISDMLAIYLTTPDEKGNLPWLPFLGGHNVFAAVDIRHGLASLEEFQTEYYLTLREAKYMEDQLEHYRDFFDKICGISLDDLTEDGEQKLIDYFCNQTKAKEVGTRLAHGEEN